MTVASPDPEEARLGRLFCVLLVVGVGIVLCLVVDFALLRPLGYASEKVTWVAIAFPLPFVPFSALCLWLAKRGRLTLAVRLYVWVNFAAIAAAAWLFEGTLSPAWLIFIWTITIAGTLLSPAHALGMTAAVAAYFILLFALTRAGLYRPTFTFVPEGLQFIELSVRIIMMVSTVGLITFLNMRGLRRALADLQREVAERRRAEGSLRQSEERFRALIEKASDILVVLDDGGTITLWSPGATEALGWTADEALGRRWTDQLHPEDRAEAEAALAELAGRPGGTAGLTLRQRHRDGSWRLVQVGARNLLAEPAVRGVVTNARDITAQRQLEEQFRQAQKLDALGRLAGGVAHDFNNLLVAILGGADYLLEELPKGHPLAAEVAEIRSAGDRAAKLVRQLLAFGRKGHARPVGTDLGEVVLGLEKLLRRTIGEHIAVTVVPAAGPCPLVIDPTSLEQVVMNLALNGRDAMPGGGQLRLEVRRLELTGRLGEPVGVPPGRWACLVVQDTGDGMSPEVRQRIFEPFFTTKEQGKGTGLGLATVFGVVQQAGGVILVESEPGRGTMFSVFLPEAEPGGAAAEAEAVPAVHRGRGQTVLLVEDDAIVRRTVAQMLQRGGYAVVQAATPAEVLPGRLAGAALLLTDLIMPGMDGVALAARLRAGRSDLPVLFMSGYAAGHVHLPPGAVLLHKPFTRERLLAEVARALGEG